MKNRATFSVVIIIFAVITVLGLHGRVSQFSEDGDNAQSVPDIYDEIMSVDLDMGYPQDPILVMDLTNKITAYLYGGDVLDEYIDDLIRQQRKMYSSTLLALNGEEQQIANIRAHLELLKELGERLLDIKAQVPVYDPLDSNLCSILVTQYANTNINNEVIYYLQREEGNWKILSYSLASDVDDVDSINSETTEEVGSDE